MKKLISILICIVLCGCSLVQEQSERELAWTEIARQTAHNQFGMTIFHVSALKAYMAERMNELPASTVKAIDLAEQLALAYDPNSITDAELGTMYGLRAKIFCDLTRQIIGPELSRYLP
jgi:hypothetical protein